jgi:signal transduction histidine kinase
MAWASIRLNRASVSLGLASMRERVRHLRGGSTSRAPGRGTTVIACAA